MARPTKEGMDYFPHDTDALNDEKIEALRMLYGNDGYAFYFILLERIYRTKDFELDVSDAETIQILARKIAITPQLFNSMLETSLKRGCFCRESYEERGVLTSEGIKKRAEVVTKKREKMRKTYEESKIEVSASETIQKPSKNESESTQSKVKQSKANIYTPEFDSFWDNYPRKKEKSKAFKCWEARLKEEGVTGDLLTQCAKNYAAEVKRKGTSEDYIKLPATFLGPNKPYEDYKIRVVTELKPKPQQEDFLAKYRKMEEEARASKSGS